MDKGENEGTFVNGEKRIKMEKQSEIEMFAKQTYYRRRARARKKCHNLGVILGIMDDRTVVPSSL